MAKASSPQYWLVKQEPSSYSWDDFVRDQRTAWTGVRNYQARNNLRAMKLGDRALYYHSVTEKRVMGIAEVVREAYPDPGAEGGDWVCVDLKPVEALVSPVTIEQVKSVPALAGMVLVKNSRLSVQPVTAAEFKAISRLSAESLI